MSESPSEAELLGDEVALDDAQAAAEAEAEAAQAQADEFEMGGLDEPPTPSGPGPSSPHHSQSASSYSGGRGRAFFPGGEAHSWNTPGGTAGWRAQNIGDRDDGDSVQGGQAGGPGGVAASPSSGRGHANQTDLGGRMRNVQGMPDYRDIPQLMKVERPITPVFPHGAETNGGWLDFDRAMASAPGSPPLAMRPVRSMCFNLPIELFSTDAYRFKHIATNLDNPTRATNICALFGLLWTGVAKGWESGEHAELHRASELQGDDEGPPSKASKKEPTFRRYMYVDPVTNMELPMFAVAYEELYDATRSRIVAVRVWKHVFNGTHSDSKLLEKLMLENQTRHHAAGAAHTANTHRSTRLVVEHERAAKLVGNASPAEVALEYHAGNQFMRICNLYEYAHALPSYGGRSDKNAGRLPLDPADVPDGAFNATLREANNGEGGVSPLSPEYVFNAKRPAALSAGLVDFQGNTIEVCSEQLEPATYFELGEGGNHDFEPPEWLRSQCGYWLQTNPYVLHPFDMPLPRSHSSGEKPGPHLLALFAQDVLHDPGAVAKPTIIDRFRGMMKEEDQATAKLLQETADAIFSFDTTTCTEEQRKSYMIAKNLAKAGMTASLEGKSTVLRQRKVLDELAEQTHRVHSKLIAPFIHRKRMQNANDRAAAQHANTVEPLKDRLDTLDAQRGVFEHEHAMLMEELFNLHADRVTRAFNSRVDKESIPQGYRKCWDGLQAELGRMRNRSANVAQWLGDGRETGVSGVQMTDSQRTPFGNIINWLGRWWEDECFIDGRDWRLMASRTRPKPPRFPQVYPSPCSQQHIFVHCFEQYTEQTQLLVLCGPKGNGKTTMLQRAAASFVDGWVTMSGPRSAKAGMQGAPAQHLILSRAPPRG